MLNERSQHILNLLIEQYIEDGQPVSSGSLARLGELKVSPATVRNVMNSLEQSGLLVSPHTSAGRIPTDLGFRVFVDHILKADIADASKYQLSLDFEESPDKLCHKAAAMLTGLTSLTSVVTVPRQNFRRIERIELVKLGTQRLLCVLCMEGGEAQNRIVELNRPLTDQIIYQTAQVLNTALSGYSFDEGRMRVMGLAKQCCAAVSGLSQLTLKLAEKEMLKPQEKLVVGGQSRLLDQSISGDVDRLRQLFEAVADKSNLISVMEKCHQAEGLKLFIGAESGADAFNQCSIISAPYKVSGEIVGALAVIGPTRMNYRNAISVVDVTSKLLSSALNHTNTSP